MGIYKEHVEEMYRLKTKDRKWDKINDIFFLHFMQVGKFSFYTTMAIEGSLPNSKI
jgi:hypothetical protein